MESEADAASIFYLPLKSLIKEQRLSSPFPGPACAEPQRMLRAWVGEPTSQQAHICFRRAPAQEPSALPEVVEEVERKHSINLPNTQMVPQQALSTRLEASSRTKTTEK